MGSNPYAAKGLPRVVRQNKVEESPASEVPAGSIKEVLEWVGGDKEKAQLALDAENSGAERKTLVKELEELLDDDAS